mmetsp:Transcript_35073/g.91954  ORF Transcript_35073/g.91954 Transcript_35073/m.91954 type:complete len:152 (-) Transcript_35073:128-583(-)
MVLHERSGQEHFAISQTYQGRRPDELQVVGSFACAAAIIFDFSHSPSLREVCQHVFKETQRALRQDSVIPSFQLPTIMWELNDLRPVPRPKEVQQLEQQFSLSELLFAVNQYADGFQAMFVCDPIIYDANSVVDTIWTDWVAMWMPASEQS